MDEPSDFPSGVMRLSGVASDNGNVYQAGRDQSVTHVNVQVNAGDGFGAVSRRVTPEDAQLHMQRVIESLAFAVEYFRRRCEKLEQEARRARAEGRREAARELSEKLREAEARVARAQMKKKEADKERERLESIVAQARYELATASRIKAWEAEAPDDKRIFDNVLASADDELHAIRAELRALADGLRDSGASAGDGRVVRGETVLPSYGAVKQPDTDAEDTNGSPVVGAQVQEPEEAGGKPRAPVRKVVLGRRRIYMGRTFFVAAGLPMPLAGAAIRVTLSHTPGVALVWVGLFPLSAVLVATLTTALLLFFARLAYAWGQSEDTHLLACSVHALLGIATFIVGVSLSPGSLPPLLAHGGLLFAEYLGPL
ncbi:hypothetical protein [Actinacidiphila sp. bgisy144]|uniref:hypothetical protein n=1 Tax=Actinacidiphila sp. bgisy144 TaxID=3413791 RepID=UPI003EB73001